MKHKVIPVLIIVVLIIMLAGGYAGKYLYDKYSYSNEQADTTSYFGIEDEADVPIILQYEKSDLHARLIDGVYYMTFSDVQEYLNDRFYYGEEEEILVYTTPTAILTAKIGESTVSSTDGSSEDLGYKAAVFDGDTLYVAMEYVKRYTNFSYTAYTDPNHITMFTEFGQEVRATIKKDTKLRLRGGVKSEILVGLKKADTVVVLEKLEDWAKVVSPDGYIGYVENKFLDNIQTVDLLAPSHYAEPEYTSVKMNGKVNLVWHSIGGQAGNSTLSSAISGTTGINVISPTWFSLSDNEGGIESFAGQDYVNTAHNNGMQVWAALDNFNNSFFRDGEGNTATVLASSTSRARLIDNLMSEVRAYGIDGINVDLEFTGSSLEDITADGGEDYIEFLRELSIACRANGTVLSVDIPVPMGNSFFHRKELGVVCDYVVIMAYDEHYEGSAEAGSVASISYVEDGIKNTLEDVPADKLVNGIPFYTRIWFTSTDGTVTSQAGGMSWASEYIRANNIEMTWDQNTCQYYGTFTKSDGTKVEIWLEDAESIQTKLNVMNVNGCAGVAAWQLGYETSDIWSILETYVNN